MSARILPNGNLLITASNTERSDLADAARRNGYYGAESLVAEMLHESFEFIPPERIGALTDAPILVDCDGLDYSDDVPPEEMPAVLPEAKVWWYPDYAVSDPWLVLRQCGHVVFTRAQEG